MRSITLAGLALVAVAAGLFTLSTSANADDHSVEVGNFYFCSQSNSGSACQTGVTAGDTVTWTVASGSHTVTQCSDAAFSSCGSGFNQQLSNGQTFQQTFSTAGTFYYHCEFHPDQMMGTVVVAAQATEAPTAAPTSPGSTTAPVSSGTATPHPSAASAPSTGGPLGPDTSSPLPYMLLALGGILLGGAAASFAIARRNT